MREVRDGSRHDVAAPRILDRHRDPERHAQVADPVLAESNPIRVDALWVRTVLLLDAPNGGIKITPLGEQ